MKRNESTHVAARRRGRDLSRSVASASKEQSATTEEVASSASKEPLANDGGDRLFGILVISMVRELLEKLSKFKI